MKIIDASWLDVSSIAGGVVVYVIYKFTRRLSWFDRRLYEDFLSGLAAVPILILMASAFNSSLLDEIKHSSRVTLIIAGAAALFALFDPRRSGSPAA